MHHPTDRITNTTGLVTPVVEHWLECDPLDSDLPTAPSIVFLPYILVVIHMNTCILTVLRLQVGVGLFLCVCVRGCACILKLLFLSFLKRYNIGSLDPAKDSLRKEILLMKEMKHNNIIAFVGACLDAPNVCLLYEHCTKVKCIFFFSVSFNLNFNSTRMMCSQSEINESLDICFYF